MCERELSDQTINRLAEAISAEILKQFDASGPAAPSPDQSMRNVLIEG
jgi:hypothetical protein